MNSSFRRNLIIGYGVSLLLLVLSSVASFISIRSLLGSAEQVGHANEVIKELDAVIMALKDGEAGQRGYILTGDDRFLIPYNGAYERALLSAGQVQRLTQENADQQKDVLAIKGLIDNRFTILENVIAKKNTGKPILPEDLESGRTVMEKLNALVSQVKQKEQSLLAERTGRMNRFAASTPALILVASVLAILVTVVSFVRVSADFKKRVRLQQELEQKEDEVQQRIEIIQDVARRISAGDYKTRVDVKDNDVLGDIAGSLNQMAQSLETSFAALSEREWVQTGIAQLNERMLGERNLEILAANVIDFLADYTKSELGAFYLTADQQKFTLAAGLALDRNKIKKEIVLGEDLAGRSALSGKAVLLDDVSETDLVVSFAAGALKPRSVLAVPVYYETKLKGVVELASVKAYNPVVQDFLKTAVYNIGMAIHSARDHKRLQDLLEETQAQSEELQAQHSELESINAELEAQTEKLQASEEELKVQQEELQEANQELEERSRLLEERNELILERNLQIQAKAEELAQSSKYKSEFLANMSHELRTPLNSILLLSRLLSENHNGNLSSDQVEYARVIQTSGNGLLTLIDEILDLSKIESGKMELEYHYVPIDEILVEMQSLFSALADQKGLEFKVEKAPDLPAMIETDRLRLEQILRNLISNALKFTSRGSVLLKISQHGPALSFAVRDTGIGIPREKQQSIFEAFQQADGSTRRKYGGTGLGLSISRELAKLLGGQIHLKSEEGKGSEFTLVVPQEKQAPLVPPGPEPEALAEPSAGQELPTGGVNGKKYVAEVIPPSISDDREQLTAADKVILIVEDDTAFARSLLDYTRKKGYKGIVAVRGDEAVALAKQFRPLGILLDIELPVKNGFEVMEELKNNPETRPIPVHIMSSHEVRTKSISKGAIDFINKPVAFEKMSEIFKRIEDALSRHPKKVLIVEENPKHAQALAYFLETFHVNAEIKSGVNEGIKALNRNEVNCVILDMGIPSAQTYATLEAVKKTPGLEQLPIIIFTGKNLSHAEEMRIRQYADSIVVKTAHSYQRILDEVSLFLHLVEENKTNGKQSRYKKMGGLDEVLKGKTVLIADDDVRNIFSMTKSLEGYGMNVLSAIDGREALKQLSENDGEDIVLMDMMMPEMDGYESIRRIREIPRFRNLPVIAVTAKAMTGDREKCISAGASDYITKPVDVDQLVSLLRVWLYQ